MPELIPDLAAPSGWLPLAFMAMMGIAMLAYVVLDGYDLGVGILLQGAKDNEKDRMIASIGPFWDANETWLVLGVGILLVAFPIAHGVILGALYLPVSLMLVGLILRGASFDFRVKAEGALQPMDRRDVRTQQHVSIDGRVGLQLETWDRLSHAQRTRYVFVPTGESVFVVRTGFGNFEKIGPVFDALVASIEFR